MEFKRSDQPCHHSKLALADASLSALRHSTRAALEVELGGLVRQVIAGWPRILEIVPSTLDAGHVQVDITRELGEPVMHTALPTVPPHLREVKTPNAL